MLNKTRTIIITLIAALSVVSVGPMTSVASARPVVKVGKIEIDCPEELSSGDVAWYPEGTKRTHYVKDGADGAEYRVNEECQSGEWIQVREATPSPTPPTSPEHVTGPLPVALGAAG